jgi:hypothetical protein
MVTSGCPIRGVSVGVKLFLNDMGNCGVGGYEEINKIPPLERRKFKNIYNVESSEIQAQIRSQCIFCNIPEERKVFEVQFNHIPLIRRMSEFTS